MNKKLILGIVLVVVVAGLFFIYRSLTCTYDCSFFGTREIPNNNLVSTTTTSITIMVPQDLAAYDKAMNEHIFDGAADPSKSWTFIEKKVTIPHTTDLVPARIQAAAGVISTQGGVRATEVAYLRVVGTTLYVLLNIHVDGWAGVSASLAKIEPIVEQTVLKTTPGITSVKFTLAPGDTVDSIIKP